jgi:hypothetical protein
MSNKQKQDPRDDLCKSAFGVINADLQEMKRLREERDDWKRRYFEETQMIQNILHSLRSVDLELASISATIPIVCSIGFVQCVLLIYFICNN